MNRPAKLSPAERAKEKEEHILNTAIDLFIEDGYHATTTRQIAKAAGVSEGTVFHYFESKSKLLETIIDHLYIRLFDSTYEGLSTIRTTQERLLFIAENHIRACSFENKALIMRLLHIYMSQSKTYYSDYRHSFIYGQHKRYLRLFDEVINEGISRGELIPDLDLTAVRNLFFGGIEYQARQMDDTRQIRRNAEVLLETVWRSIAIKPKEKSQPNTNQEIENLFQRLERVVERLER